MKKHYFIAMILLSVFMCGCSRSRPVAPATQANVTIKNDSDSHPVQIFWTATGCGGVDMEHGASSICHQEVIAGKQSAEFTFAKNMSDRAVLLYRLKEYCALPHNSDLLDTRVPDEEVLHTDGCTLQKDTGKS